MKKVLSFAILSALSFFVASSAFAAVQTAPKQNGYITIENAVIGPSTPTMKLFDVFGGFGRTVHPGAIAGNIIMSLLGFVGIILVGIVTYAGFLWMTASGEEEKVKKAQSMISQAIIGLIIVMMTWSITYFVVTWILKCTQQTCST